MRSDSPNGHDGRLTEPVDNGRRATLDQLIPIVYEQLRAMAHHRLAMGEQGGTLSTTALVHEAYLKLVNQPRVGWNDDPHFFALVSVAMRHVLVDRARARLAQKRDGGVRAVTLDESQIASEDQPQAVLDIDNAVEKLGAIEPRLAKVVECRFFGGLSEDETARALGVTARTVQRDWAKARMLLRRALLE